MKLGVHIHLNLYCAANETPVRNSKYFSSFGRFANLQFILPYIRNYLTFLLHFQLRYLNQTWHIHFPNHSTRIAFHSGRKFCIPPKVRTFHTFSYATSAYNPTMRFKAKPTSPPLVKYTSRHKCLLSTDICNYLFNTYCTSFQSTL